MTSRSVWCALKYLLALGLLGWVFLANWEPGEGPGLKVTYEAYVFHHTAVRYDCLLLAILFCLSAILLTFCRWYLLVRMQNLPLSLSEAFRLGAVGFFFNTFLPGSVGGDIVKAAILARRESRPVSAVATVFLDRAIGLWTLIAFACVTATLFSLPGVWPGEAPLPFEWIALTTGVSLAGSAVLWLSLGRSPVHEERFACWLRQLPRVGNAAAEVWQVLLLTRRRPRKLLAAMGLSGVSHVGFVVTFYLCSQTLTPSALSDRCVPSLMQHFLIVPVGLLIRAIPISPGGMGISELGFAELYRRFGYPGANGVLAALVYRVVQWLLGLIGYLVSLRRWSQAREDLTIQS